MCELDIWKAATLFIGNWMPCIKAGEEAWDKEDNDTSETCEPARRRKGRQIMLQVKATFMQHKTTSHMYRNIFGSLVKKWRIYNLKTPSFHIDHCDSAVQWVTLVLPLRIFWKIGRGAVVDQLVCQSFGLPLLTVKSIKSVVSCWWPKARSLHSSWKKSFHPF